ncbi:MAG: MBL fold metallo-hydrolase [Christensenellaceae bacterium]|nr:MBL fold metallo-hydrolase [Christensenellaceae bacterium]
MADNNAGSLYSTTVIDKDFYAIEENGVRCFLIVGEDRALLIDTGYGNGNIANYIMRITDKPVTLINTHTDGDHIGGNNLFEKIYMHPAEFDYYSQKNNRKPLPIWEGDVISCGDYSLEVILIPGHTPGSIALLDRKHRFLISGDSVSRVPIFMFNQGRNMYAYIASMKKLRTFKDCFDKIYTSHGELVQYPSIIDELIEGAEAVITGNVEPENPPRPLPCKLYRYKNVMFLIRY